MIYRLTIILLLAYNQAYGQIVEWHLKDGHTLYSEIGGVAMWGSLNYEKQWVTLHKYVGISTSAGVLQIESYGKITKAYPLRATAQVIQGRHRLGISFIHMPYRIRSSDEGGIRVQNSSPPPIRLPKIFARVENRMNYNYTYQAPSGFFLRVDCSIFTPDNPSHYLASLYYPVYYSVFYVPFEKGQLFETIESKIHRSETTHPWFGLGIGWTFDHDKAEAKRAHKMLPEPKAAHTFYVEGMGPGWLYTVNYDKIWHTRNPNFHFTTAVGFVRYMWPEITFYKPDHRFDVIPIRAGILAGKDNWYFEGGLTYVRQKWVVNANFPQFGWGPIHNLHWHFGLRYQQPQGGLFVRATAMPIIYRIRSFLDFAPMGPDRFGSERPYTPWFAKNPLNKGHSALWPGIAVGYTIPRSKSARQEISLPELHKGTEMKEPETE